MSKRHSEKRKLHLMKWDNVVKSEVIGGLGLGNLKTKVWLCYQNGGGGLGKRGKLRKGELLLQNMGWMSRVGFLIKFLGIGCRVYGETF